MSDQEKKEALEALLREGTMSYLDALNALQRFQRTVSDAATIVLKRRLPELARAVGISGPKVSDVVHSCEPDYQSSDRDGTWAWIGSAVWFPEPWGQSAYLGLSFKRQEAGDESRPYVTFSSICKRAGDYTKLKLAYRDRGGKEYYDDENQTWDCGFCWELENPVELESQFSKMMDYAIDVWNQIGGWDHLLN